MPPTRKSLSFLTLKPNAAKKSRENSFLFRLSEHSTTIQRRQSMRMPSKSKIPKSVVSFFKILKKRKIYFVRIIIMPEHTRQGWNADGSEYERMNE